MNTEADITFVSCFGRGLSLAAEMALQGAKVSLIDVTHFLGNWTPEDGEGPFGFFQTEDLSDLQREGVHEEGYFDSVDQGFCVLLPEGPIDFKSQVTEYLLKEKGIEKACNWLKELPGASEKHFDKKMMKDLDSFYFSESWIIYLTYQLSSTSFYLNNYKKNISFKNKTLPIFSSYFVRRVSRRGQEQLLNWVQDKGVQVFLNSKIKDISLQGNSIDSIEVKGEWSGVLKSDQWVWMLSGEESAYFGSFSKALYPQGILKSTWSWVRFRLTPEDSESLEKLPLKFLVIPDLELPWTHSNLCWLQKVVNNKDIDVWVRIPTQHRFQRSYLENLGDKICKKLNHRIPGIQLKILDMPQDYIYSESELGPSRFGSYEGEEKSKYKLKAFKNLFFESPETWTSQDLNSQLRSQVHLKQQLLNHYRKKLEVKND